LIDEVPMKFPVSLLVLSCLLGMGGCVPLGELEQENVDLQAKVDSLQERQATCTTQLATLAMRIEVLEKDNIKVGEENKRLTTRLSEMASLPVVTTEPTETPAQISAPSEPVQRTAEPIAETPPPVAETKAPVRQKPQQESRQQQTTTYVPPLQSISSSEPADEAFLSRYQNALAAHKARRYSEAIEQFNELLNTSKANDMTDNCAYWIGEALFAQRSYREAIQWFNKVLVSRGSDKLDDALMMRGNIYLQMDQPSKAAEDFQRIVNEFPNGEYFATARTKLKSIRSVPQGAHVSSGKRKK
jgi:TolA-binding protein